MYKILKEKSFRQQINFLLKDTAIYGLASTFNQLLKIITVPFIVRYYSKTDFATNDLLYTLMYLTLPFLFLGLDSAIARFYFEFSDSEKKKALVLFCFVVGLFLSFASMFILLKLEYIICYNFFKIEDAHNSFIVIVITLPFLFITSFFTNLFKYNFLRKEYLIQTIGTAFITVILTFIFVVLFRLPIVYTLIAHLISRFLLSVIAIIHGYKMLGNSFQFTGMRAVVLFALPFAFTSIAGVLLPSIDKIIITNYLNLSYLATYVFALRITGILALPLKSFQTAWGPFSMSLFNTKSASFTYSKTLLFSTFILSLFCIWIMGFQKILIIILGSSKYSDSARVIPILSTIFLIQNIIGILGLGISLAKKPIYYIIIYITSLFLGFIIIKIFLVFNILGVALGMIFAQLINLFLSNKISKKIYPILKIESKKPILILIYTILSALIFTYFHDLSYYHQIMLSIVLSFLLIYTFYTSFLSSNEKLKLFESINHIRLNYFK
jgi:O-antigen/teichoic acid export membrane protein